MPEAQADTEFGYLPGAGGIEVLTCGLGIRESGSPHLFMRRDSFLPIRCRSGSFRLAICNGILQQTPQSSLRLDFSRRRKS